MAITVEGKRYHVVEDLGYCHDVGAYVKIVAVDYGKERAARRSLGQGWVWHVPQIRPRGRYCGQMQQQEEDNSDGSV